MLKIALTPLNNGYLRARVLPATLLVAFVLAATSCQGNRKDELRQLLIENPEIILDAIKKHPIEFVETLQIAADSSRQEMIEKRYNEEQRRIEQYFEHPLTPEIRGDEGHFGDFHAELKLVVYSDFQCPFCRQGRYVVESLLDEYEGDIVYIYKHMPLSFHSEARPAAKYFEALRLKSNELAMEFHDYIFNNQDNFRMGDAFLTMAIREVGEEREELDRVIEQNPEIAQRINQDMQEAERFGFEGTPAFVLNGVAINGAYPKEHFVEIIEQLRSRRQIQITEN